MIELRRYTNAAGEDVVGNWLRELRDVRTRAKIAARLARLAAGGFGDCKPLREGVWELRIDWGPGYRVYYARTGRMCLLLLCGGDKRSQAVDIVRAVGYWRDFERRTGLS